MLPVKRHRGSRDTRTQGHTDHTNEPHISHPDPPTHDPGDDPRGRADRPTADSEEAAPSEPAAPGTVTADDRSSHCRRVGRGAPRLRVGTAMAVAGAMPMVLAVDASPLTQLNAELPSGAHGMPIGNL